MLELSHAIGRDETEMDGHEVDAKHRFWSLCGLGAWGMRPPKPDELDLCCWLQGGETSAGEPLS